MGAGQNCEELLDRYFEDVYAYVSYRVAPDREAARDLTQDVFLEACASLASLHDRGSVLSWLRAIARTRVARHFRLAAMRPTEVLAPVETLAELPAVNPGTDHDECWTRVVQVSLVMRSLPDVYADALEEKYLEGFSVQTMAEQRGQSAKAVESILTRAREAFRAAWRRTPETNVENRSSDERSSIHES
jgi:RNA polymerase sigma-70 factor (ECF subfamily)